MKKWIALLLASIMMLSCLAGCGDDAKADGTIDFDAKTAGDANPPEGAADEQVVKLL